MRRMKGSEKGRETTRVVGIAVVLVGVLLLVAVTSDAEGRSVGEEYQIRGKLLEPGENVSAGGSFGVAGKSVLPSNGLEDREFTLEPARLKRGDGSNGCPCQGLFSDGFESGDLGAWNAASGS